MIRLRDVSAEVKAVLCEVPQSRSNDCYLYLHVLLRFAKRQGVKLQGMTISEFLLRRAELNLPNFESVRRARQKLQVRYPELVACDKVQGYRLQNELVYRNFFAREEEE